MTKDRYANAYYRHKETKTLVKIENIEEKTNIISYRVVRDKYEVQSPKNVFIRDFTYVENGFAPPMTIGDEGEINWPSLQKETGKRVSTKFDGTVSGTTAAQMK